MSNTAAKYFHGTKLNEKIDYDDTNLVEIDVMPMEPHEWLRVAKRQCQLTIKRARWRLSIEQAIDLAEAYRRAANAIDGDARFDKEGYHYNLNARARP